MPCQLTERLVDSLRREAMRVGLVEITNTAFATVNEAKIMPFEGGILVMRRRKGDHEVGGPRLDAARGNSLFKAWSTLNDNESDKALVLLTEHHNDLWLRDDSYL